VVAGRDQHRFRDDADKLLDEQRGARKQSACITASWCRVRLGAEQPEPGAQGRGESGGELDRGPVVLCRAEPKKTDVSRS
jgi:hypothetical protein